MRPWQHLKVDFFVNEILKRYWNHEEGTTDKIIEFQFFPGLLIEEPDRRAFVGYDIVPWCTYASEKSKEVRDIVLRNSGISGLRDYEKNYALGLLITRGPDEEGGLNIAPLTNKESYNIFLTSSLGYGESQYSYSVSFWFNPGENENGNFYDFTDPEFKPHENRMVKVRVWDKESFWKEIEYYVKHNKFRKSVKSDDPDLSLISL